ncbi:GNAT family N-acetyltransferase [Gemmobacter sp.]|uniref:GNAT family N-acetyltransferase n=1 Tax=Gemmobacter sp. TaxID=1898957 RepID=UPI002B00112E|nr:GNAT family N-acetyltransferase [Gemmobacter sp.]
MIRLAAPGDEQALAGFLAGHLETSMFAASNLETQGLGGGDHPHATRFVLHLADGRIAAVLGLSNNGFLLCQAPQLTPDLARAMLAPLAGLPAQGMTGEAGQVAGFLAALDSQPALNTVEPLFSLDLDRLPDSLAPIRPAQPQDVPLLTGWFAAYLRETQTGPATQAETRARAAVGGPVRLLVQDGQPVAMASINAAAGDTVQLGGVFTPAERRGQGLAGLAVAALLAERRAAGARRAILFAASESAARAYTRIGFRRIGSYRIALWPGRPVGVRP